MAFHSEIKINYQVLQDIVDSFKGYERALNDMQDSIARMDRVISENEGQTFDALGKIKHDFDDEIETCKEEVKDIYSSVENYLSDMRGIIDAKIIGNMLIVDRLDIYWNKESIKDACDSIGPRMYQLGAAYRNVTIHPSAYEHKPEEFAKIRMDTRRNEAMHEAIRSAYETICEHYEKIDGIYDDKVVKFENKDDEHEESIKALHAKYTSWTEGWRELKECAWDFVRGVWDGLKGIVIGLVDLGKLGGQLVVYGGAKIIGVEPPKWSKEAVNSLKGATPWTIVEAFFQEASDSAAENGWAYGAGKIAPDVVLTLAGAKGLDKVAKVDKLGDVGDATKAASMVDNIADMSKLEKFDDLSDISKAEKVDVDDVSKVAEAAKKERPSNATKPFQEHHFATNKSKTYTPQLEEVTNKYGLDLDDAWNKDLMPHQGRHPNEYHEYTLDSMKQFDEIALGDKDVFLKLFDAWKENVRNNPDMLYKNYWE